MRVCFFGGSFDPPHRGHLAVALAAANTFHLDRVLFSPVARQPLKRDSLVAPYEDRMAMVELACAGHGELLLPTRADAPRSDGLPNYTVDTLTHLRRLWPGAQMFSLIGADAFADIARWHRSTQLLRLARWIVVTRPGVTLAGLNPLPRSQGRILLLDTVNLDISATGVRRRLAEGLPCEDLLPGPVRRYIERHGLYGARPARLV